MKAGFYTIMAAQFFSSLADNALLIAAIRLLQEMHEPEWMQPSLQQSFVLFYVILAPLVGADLDVMARDAKRMRGEGPTVFAQVKNGIGVEDIVRELTATWERAVGTEK